MTKRTGFRKRAWEIEMVVENCKEKANTMVVDTEGRWNINLEKNPIEVDHDYNA